MKSILSLSCLAVAGLVLNACPAGGGGGPSFSCATLPTAPACQDVSSGDTTTSPSDTTGDSAPEEVSCTPDCTGKTCGPNGCGGFCGTCGVAGTTCVSGACVEGVCGAGGVVATGELEVGGGITFDKATLTVEHKMDVDAFEDGCITSVVIELGRGFGCTLRVEANTATAPGGGLRITQMSFAADSQCPGFPDESEGQYTDFSQMRVLAVVPSIAKVPDANAPASCITANFDVKLEGVLVEPSTQKTLNVAVTSIRLSGETSSTGSTTASCPCASSCNNKECGSDGCGFTCGACASNEECNPGGQCQCIPECDGKECGDDGCGGSCGACGEFEACELGGCVACEPTCTVNDECGDNGCGGDCGTCSTNETCNGQDRCVCPGPDCGGECCKVGDKCNANACCTPQCNGKECGSDGCGGTCGTCTGLETCGGNGQCSCTPDCDGKECGDNGCGGSCGSCGGGESCLPEGICATVTQECDFEGFAGVAEVATNNTDNITYLQLTSTTASFDGLRVEMWKINGPSGPEYPFESLSAYTIPASNYANCALCILILDGCTAAGDCNNATKYLAQSGTFTVVGFADATGETFEAVLTDVIAPEVTIDAQFNSTIKPNGRTWCLTNQVFLGPVQLTPPQ